jgi:lipopolysaccharide/colanic/teichoic acid biosynthesis glycosyltransferase
MTGWAQVNGLRGDTSIEERIKFDLYYIENWSFALDIKILLRTVRVALSFKEVH